MFGNKLLKRAFTLVEMLIVLVLLGAVIVMYVSFVSTDIGSPEKIMPKANILGTSLNSMYQKVRNDSSYTDAQRDLGTYITTALSGKKVVWDIASTCNADAFLKNNICDKLENYVSVARNGDITVKATTFGTLKNKLLNDSGNKNVTDTSIDDTEPALQICFKTGKPGNLGYICSENVYSVNKTFAGYAPDAN